MSSLFVTSRLLSSIPGLRHAFATRCGGVSTGPFASLNLGFGRDDARSVRENRRLLGEATRLPEPWFEVQQHHGIRVVAADDVGPNTAADGILLQRPHRTAAVRTADCVPILICALDRRQRPGAVAAVHAGWRGTVGGIVREALGAFVRRGWGPESLRVALGPSISAAHFEVGPEVISAARRSLATGKVPAVRGRGDRWQLDLPELVRRHLIEAGVRDEHIDISRACTFRDADRFFSHRRQRGRTGHHLSLVGFFEDQG